MLKRLQRLFVEKDDTVPDFTSRELLELIVSVSQIVNERKEKPEYAQIAASYGASIEQEKFLSLFGAELGQVNEHYDALAEQQRKLGNSWYKFRSTDQTIGTIFLFAFSLLIGVGGFWGLMRLFGLLSLYLPAVVLSHVFCGGYLTLKIFDMLMTDPITYFRLRQLETNRQEEIRHLVDKYYSKLKILPDSVKFPELSEDEKFLLTEKGS